MNMYKQVDNHVELCIHPSLEKEIRSLFGKEIDGGSRTVMEDGRILFSFDLTKEKSAFLHLLADLDHSLHSADQLDSNQVRDMRECTKGNES